MAWPAPHRTRTARPLVSGERQEPAPREVRAAQDVLSKAEGGGGMSWKPTDEGHAAAAGDWSVGDRVNARANAINVRRGSRGTVVGFSEVGGHPLVDFDDSGLVLIRAEHLARDDAPAEARSPGRPRSSDTTRLSATPRPPAVEAAPPPPPPDWFARPPQPPADEGNASAPEQSDEEFVP
jgi:hypothetical protein